MQREPIDLKAIIDSSVSLTKPKLGDIDAIRLTKLIEAQPDARGQIIVSALRGGAEKTGASSGIVLFDAVVDGQPGRFVLRYAPMNNPGRIFVDYGIAGQFALQSRLHRVGVPAPRPRWLDADGTSLGLPGFIMDHVDGEVADGSAYTGGLFADVSPEQREAMHEDVLRKQGLIHDVDWQALGLADHVKTAPGRTPIERYLNWFWRTAEWIETSHLDRLARIRKWLFDNQPRYHADDHALVHGDPGLGNYVFRDGKIVAVLDWELAGIVHPSWDIAMSCSLNDFFRAAAAPDVAARIPTESAWLSDCERVTQRRVVDFAYFRKAVTLPSLIVSLSMNRNMPEPMRSSHLEMLEPLWAMAERA